MSTTLSSASRRTTLTLAELATAVNPVLAGWLAYFTRFYPTAVIPLCKRIDRYLIHRAKRKYKRLERGDKRVRFPPATRLSIRQLDAG